MADTAILLELASDVLPRWIDRLRKYIPPESTASKIITPATVLAKQTGKAGEPVVIAPPSDDAPQESPMKSAGPLNDLKAFIPLTQTHGMSKLNSRPDAHKSRFSSITGPTIYYDGESQAMLNDLWNMINSRRGLLRREMMNIKRRQQYATIASQISSDESSQEDEEKKDDGESDDGAELLRMKMKLQREKMLRMTRRAGAIPDLVPGQKRKATSSPEPQANTEEDSKFKTLLEAIDDNLDKTTKVCETAAFIWLKGDPVTAHLKFMIGRLRDTIIKIVESGLVKGQSKQGEEGETPEEEAQRKEEADTPMPPISKAVAEGKGAMKDGDSALEVASSCADNGDASSIDTTENPKMAAAKRRMKEVASKLEARHQLHSSMLRNRLGSPPQVDVLS